MALPSGNIHGCYWSDMVFFTKQGSYLTDIRVSKGSWIRKAKPRDEVESFFSWKSLAGRLHPLLPHTHHVGPGQVGPEGVRRKTAIRLPHGSRPPFPAVPCPTPCLGATLTLSHL